MLEYKGTISQIQVFVSLLTPCALNPMDIGAYADNVGRIVLVQRRVGELVDTIKDLLGVEQAGPP